MLSSGLQAQSFLKKIGKAIDNVSNTVDKAANKLDKATQKLNGNVQKSRSDNTSTDRTSSSTEDFETSSSKAQPKGHVSNLYKMGLDHGFGDSHCFEKAFGKFKQSAATKVITLDNIKGIRLGYFNDGRAFVSTPANGLMCIDKKGNIVKQWKPGEMVARQLGSDAVDYPKFDSGRFITIETDQQYASYGTAIIYDTNFNVVKRIPKVAYASNYEDGVAIINKWTGKPSNSLETAYIDVNGNEIFANLSQLANVTKRPLDGRQLRSLNDGLAAFAVKHDVVGNCKWGFRDAKGNIVAQPRYSQVQDFSNGLAAVELTENGLAKWGFIDTKGNMVIQPKYTIQPSQFDNCGLAMVINKDGISSFINKKGETVGDSYTDITPFCNGRALYTEFKSGEQGKWVAHRDGDLSYLIDSNFNIIATIGERMQFAHPDNGMVYYRKGFNWSDNYKHERFAEFYVQDTFFHNGRIYLRLSSDGFNGILGPNGDLTFVGISGPFTDGLAPVTNTSNMTRENNVAGYVNEQGEWAIKFDESNF